MVGEHELSSDMNYTEIIQKLTLKHTTRFQVRIVIPEGLTVDQIIDIFLENGMGTKEGFVEAINNYPYKHEFVKQLEELGYPEDRKYRLEGYLYPDTYDFYIDAKEYLIINTLLNNFNRKFWSGYKSEYQDICEELGMTFDDIITLASMIEAEGNNALDFEYISYVFHNRIKNSTKYPEFQFLQSDATIQYVLDARREDLTVDDLKLDNPYNTYVYKGLPPGAICNPGYDAISAALYPSAPVDDNDKTINAFYFVSNKVGKTYYSTTLLGHNNNKEKVRKDNAAIDAGTYYN
ncbi:MAG: endolytic transglycosylase MltG [Firmicutes bacterium HGW-Firmicutes-21]|nr:MAG: endolytic transglycosylase MltG [Firmicutes bacterium HGW-Firmicutes-21]